MFAIDLGRDDGIPCILKHLFSILRAVRDITGPNVGAAVGSQCFGSTYTAPTATFPALIGLTRGRLRGVDAPGRIRFDGRLARLVTRLPRANFPTQLDLPRRNTFRVNCCRRARGHFTGGGRRRWAVSRPVGGHCSFIVLFSIRGNGPGNSPSTNGVPHVSPRANCNLIASIYLGQGVHGCIRALGRSRGNCHVCVGSNIPLGHDSTRTVGALNVSPSLGTTGGTSPSVSTGLQGCVYRGCFSVHTFNTIVAAFIGNTLGYNRIHNPIRLDFTQSISPVIPRRIAVAHITVAARTSTRGGNARVNHGRVIPCTLCHTRNCISTGLTQGAANFSRSSLGLL